MQDQDMRTDDASALAGVAELLLWIGWDRAADAIYAAIEDQTIIPCDPTEGTWDEAFAG